MRRRIWNAFFAFVLTLSVVLPTTLICKEEVKAASTGVMVNYEPGLSVSTGQRGDETQLTVGIRLSEAAAINGIHFSVEFDARKLTYQAGSATVLRSHFDGATIHYAGDGTLNFVWTGQSTAKLPTNFNILSASFVVNDNAEAGTTDLAVAMSGIYKTVTDGGSFEILSHEFDTRKTVTFTVGEPEPAVKNVIDMIDNIGTVEYTDESKAKIDAAADAYNNLTTAQQSGVYNADELTAAQEQYAKLQAENLSNAEVEAEVVRYKTAHADALAITSDDILNATDSETQLKLANLLETALADYKDLSARAQAKLLTEKNLLNQYLELLEDMVKAAEEAEAERLKQEALKKEAWEALYGVDGEGGYLQSFEYSLDLTTETVRLMDEGVVNDAWTGYKTHAGLDYGIYFVEYFAEAMEEQGKSADHLEQLLAKLAELNAALPNPKSEEELKADEWEEQFSAVLALDSEDLTYEDAVDIRLGKLLLDSFSDEVRAYIDTEKITKIETLYEAALLVEPEEGESLVEYIESVIYETVTVTEEVAGETSVITKIIERITGKNVEFRVKGREMSKVVWLLLLLAASGILIFIILYTYYYFRIVRGGRKQS